MRINCSTNILFNLFKFYSTFDRMNGANSWSTDLQFNRYIKIIHIVVELSIGWTVYLMAVCHLIYHRNVLPNQADWTLPHSSNLFLYNIPLSLHGLYQPKCFVLYSSQFTRFISAKMFWTIFLLVYSVYISQNVLNNIPLSYSVYINQNVLNNIPLSLFGLYQPKCFVQYSS